MTNSVDIPELGKAGTCRFFEQIKSHLIQIGIEHDDVLPEYILVLLANKHSNEKICSELDVFFGSGSVGSSASFVDWLVAAYNEALSSADTGKAVSPSMMSTSEQVASVVIKPESSKNTIRPLQAISSNPRGFRNAIRAVGDSRSHPSKSSSGGMEVDARVHGLGHAPERSPDQKDIGTGRRTQRKKTVAGSTSSIVDARELLNRKRRERSRDRIVDGNDKRDEKMARPRRGDRDSVKVRSRSLSETRRPQLVRCSFWPTCKAGDTCPFAHPKDLCSYFPNCSYGNSCINVHPSFPCKFGERCINPSCNYQHAPPAATTASTPVTIAPIFNPFQTSTTSILCRFHPNCTNSMCPFMHPKPVPCRYGEACKRSDCPFEHPTSHSRALKTKINMPCRYGRQCARSDCPYQHETLSSETAINDPALPSSTSLPPLQPTPIDSEKQLTVQDTAHNMEDAMTS